MPHASVLVMLKTRKWLALITANVYTAKPVYYSEMGELLPMKGDWSCLHAVLQWRSLALVLTSWSTSAFTWEPQIIHKYNFMLQLSDGPQIGWQRFQSNWHLSKSMQNYMRRHPLTGMFCEYVSSESTTFDDGCCNPNPIQHKAH